MKIIPIRVYTILALIVFSSESHAGIFDQILSDESEFEIYLKPTEFTHYDPLEHQSVIKKGRVSGRNKIIKKGNIFSFYSKAASQDEFELRSQETLISEQSSVYRHFGDSVKLTFLVENESESEVATSVHVIHFMKIDGIEFYTYYNSLKNIIYRGDFEVTYKNGANQSGDDNSE